MPIPSLPVEILENVASFLAPSEYPDLYFAGAHTHPAPNLALAFQAIDNLLYRHLFIGAFWSGRQNEKATLLHHTLRQRPLTDRRIPLSKTLTFDLKSLERLVPRVNAEALGNIIQDLASLIACRNGALHIYDHFDRRDSYGWTCLNAALNNSESRVKKLILTSDTVDQMMMRTPADTPTIRGLSPDDVHSVLQGKMRWLKELRLDRLSPSIPRNITQLQGARGTAPFTKLSLYGFGEGHRDLKALINWPTSLEEFEIAGWFPMYPFRQLVRVLVPHDFPREELLPLKNANQFISSLHAAHGSTLKSLHIGPLGCLTQIPERPLPELPLHELSPTYDFSIFEKLTFLSLSPCITSFKFGWVNIFAPNLEIFELVIFAQGSAGFNLDDFQQPAENFLRELARTISNSSSLKLRTIKIVYAPRNWFVTARDHHPAETTQFPSMVLQYVRTHTEYPWDRMERPKEEMRGLGIKFEYSEPNITREAFNATWRRYLYYNAAN
ncbi:hypothetical protein QBC38DRAFT_526838 [Podospora fimiseda]|uniref:Uncharacterized protein n=1 Tax=Podospora fimiseda TaxID=252190 RepID=A0AAN7BQ05_9PEZI|nr:hypothetical protein QBC38DRAFT_526838 [Podospora fimiseda]